ncbi:MAG: hypothetical protein ACRBK7_02745 [Acidimicrobiales bacterium]
MRIRSVLAFFLLVAAMAVAVPTPSSAADSEVLVRARGRLGTENVDLLINDAVVASWDLTGPWFETFVYKLPADVEVVSMGVRHDSGPWPEAVIVDWVELHGQRHDSSDPNTLSFGSWDAVTGCAEGLKQSDWLTCDNSWFDYDVSGRSRQLITVTARGRLGTEDAHLIIDGQEVASYDLDTDFQTFYYRMPPGQLAASLRVENDDDGWPNAVIVDNVTAGGLKYKSSHWRTLSSGSWDSARGCGQGVKMSDWLTCDNSWFDYGIDYGWPKYRVVRVSARGRLGTESFDLIVNGSKVNTWNLGTDYQFFTHLYSPGAEETTDSVRIESNGPGWPNAVIVDYVDVEGFKIDTSDGRTLSSGSWTSSTGCAEGFKRSDWLTCDNAWLEYDLRSARDPLG